MAKLEAFPTSIYGVPTLEIQQTKKPGIRRAFLSCTFLKLSS